MKNLIIIFFDNFAIDSDLSFSDSNVQSSSELFDEN